MGNPLALVVEDHVDSAVIFDEALKRAGFETEVIYAGDAAFARLSAAVPDLVVLDLNLPHVLGTEIVRQIRTDPRLAKVRIIVATAHQELAREVQDEVDAVLIKPVSFSQLRELATRLGIETPAE